MQKKPIDKTYLNKDFTNIRLYKENIEAIISYLTQNGFTIEITSGDYIFTDLNDLACKHGKKTKTLSIEGRKPTYGSIKIRPERCGLNLCAAHCPDIFEHISGMLEDGVKISFFYSLCKWLTAFDGFPFMLAFWAVIFLDSVYFRFFSFAVHLFLYCMLFIGIFSMCKYVNSQDKPVFFLLYQRDYKKQKRVWLDKWLSGIAIAVLSGLVLAGVLKILHGLYEKQL